MDQARKPSPTEEKTAAFRAIFSHFTRSVILLTVLAVSTGCATSALRDSYEQARNEIIEAHESALFAPDAPWLTANPGKEDPELRETPAFLRAIREKYFAATGVRVTRYCKDHFVACGDAQAFEWVVRSIHNAEIRESQAAKLKALESSSPSGVLAGRQPLRGV